MADTLTPEQRRRAMQANRPTGGKTTEWALRARLAAAGISGWSVQPKDILGKPDFAFRDVRIAIFVDGCFWHGCHQHRSIPETNRAFWEEKIQRNIQRDEDVSEELRQEGWMVLRYWEHDLNNRPLEVVAEIEGCLANRQ